VFAPYYGGAIYEMDDTTQRMYYRFRARTGTEPREVVRVCLLPTKKNNNNNNNNNINIKHNKSPQRRGVLMLVQLASINYDSLEVRFSPSSTVLHSVHNLAFV
jgi:hypothetical protein